MHNPRGSNNRLNEKSANRRNGNRAFDSQNNNKGGYNIGDRGANGANNENEQYLVKYEASTLSGETKLLLEWTNQHGCGDTNNKVRCNQVIQYMCQPMSVSDPYERMRDGTSTDTQNYQGASERESQSQFNNRKRQLRTDRVLHEGIEWYDKCDERERNKGLYIADQKVGNNAKNTRQNPGGTRRGLECPEERDYHPYWHPSPWRDIAVLSQNESFCELYQNESFNVKPKHECVENFRNSQTKRHHSEHNNEEDCEEEGGEWMELHSFLEKATNARTEAQCNALTQTTGMEHEWAVPYDGWKNDYQKECLVKLPRPVCRSANFSRVNHLGNSINLEPLNYEWTLPYFPSLEPQRCVLRIRYNISTDDYDMYGVTSQDNNNKVEKEGLEPLIENDPNVQIGADGIGLQLAINTAQFSRTFQDRSHVFEIYPRSSKTRNGQITNTIPENAKVHNLNVRGKRGNIVQTFPAVEYDFFPTNLTMSEDDMVHIQWTGSNTHNNQNPAGDGQAGDDGEGKGGSDRSNILGLLDPNSNYPADMDNPKSIFNNIKKIVWTGIGNKDTLTNKDIAIQMASSGYFHCLQSSKCGGNSMERKSAMDKTLDNAPASYIGAILQLNPGVYHIVCTRNNNFTNRSQKGVIIVTKSNKKK